MSIRTHVACWLALAVSIALPGCARQEQALIFAAEAPRELETALRSRDADALAELSTPKCATVAAECADHRRTLGDRIVLPRLFEAGPVHPKVTSAT